MDVDVLAAAEAKTMNTAEKQTQSEWAITQLAGLYQPVDTVNKTPCPTNNAFEVCEAHQLSQVGSLLTVKRETPLAPVSLKHPATHSNDDNANYPTLPNVLNKTLLKPNPPLVLDYL